MPVLLLKIACHSAGTVWPDILCSVQCDIRDMLRLLEAKQPLPAGLPEIEQRAGGRVFTLTLLRPQPEQRYTVYTGLLPGDAQEVCVVEHGGALYHTDQRLALLLERIVAGGR